MKVNGKLWILAGFKEGLSLGDRTSAESTLLTWGVNSVWSNLNNWREEWRQQCFVLKWPNSIHQTLYKSLQVNSSIYGFWNDIKTHECGAININCSAQARLHWTMHEDGARMKLWRFWRMQNLGCTNVSTRAGRSFRSPTASSKTQLQPQILIVPLLYLRHEAPSFARGATQLLVRSLDWWCSLHVSRALGRIGTKMQTSEGAQIDYCFARCRIEGTCFSFRLFMILERPPIMRSYGSFLAQICFDHGNDTLSANLLEFPSNHFVCFKCLESSCCFLAHPGSSLSRHVQVTNLPAC